MFKIECFVEDKRVGDALRALAGIARGQPSVIPMINAEPTKDGSGVKAKVSGGLLNMFIEHLTKERIDTIKSGSVKDYLKSIGKSGGSATYLLQQAHKAGLVRKTGKGNATVYHVVKRITHNG